LSSSVVLVSTPLQAICAAEWLASQTPVQAKLILLHGRASERSPTQESQLTLTAETLGLAPSMTCFSSLDRSQPIRVLSSYGHLRQIYPLLSDAAELVIGNAASGVLMRAAANSFKGPVTVIDDGTISVPTMLSRRYLQTKPTGSLRNCLLGELEGKIRRRLNWFTLFPIESAGVESRQMNTLGLLRRKLAEMTPNLSPQTTFFLGQPGLASGNTSEKDFLAHLRLVRERVSGEILYLPHRRERQGEVNLAAAELNARVHYSALPIELAIGRELPVPETVISAGSTALFTLRLLLAGYETRLVMLVTQGVLTGRHFEDLCDQMAIIRWA
jgi:hypothetical protein